MPQQETLKQWTEEVSSHMGHLSGGLRGVLAIYVYGMVLTRQCGQSFVTEMMALVMGVKANTMRQRLRELTYESQAKRGEKRQELDVSKCFAPLMKWVLEKVSFPQGKVILAIDATYLRDRFTILVVSVVVAGCALPVAWHIQKGDEKGQWHPIWLRLLGYVKEGIPPNWQVSVVADGGLYSKKLFNAVLHLGWHPHMRIGTQGLCREANGAWMPLAHLATPGMTPTLYRLICFKGNPLACTLLVEWDASYDKPCLVVTDLSPHTARHETYHWRFWIECGFKDFKRGGLHWEQSKMSCPKRAERLWLVMSIALLYLVTLGVSAEHAMPFSTYSRSMKRTLSCVNRGWITFIVQLLSHPRRLSDPLIIPVLPYTYP